MAVHSKARHDLTIKAIKHEIQNGNDVSFWLSKSYEHLDSGLFDESDIMQIEKLAQEYYDKIERVEDETPDVEEITQE